MFKFQRNKLFSLGRLVLFSVFVLTAAFLAMACGGGSTPKPSVLYKVMFEADGGEPIPEPQMVPAGGKVELPDLMTRTKSSFSGWYKDYDCTEPWDFDTDTVNGNIILFANWKSTASKGGGGRGREMDGYDNILFSE